MMRMAMMLMAATALTGCGSDDQDGVGGVSASDARALNEAAARLDAQAGPAGSGEPGLNPAAAAAARADRERRPAAPR